VSDGFRREVVEILVEQGRKNSDFDNLRVEASWIAKARRYSFIVTNKLDRPGGVKYIDEIGR
jgi:hypothetical protein